MGVLARELTFMACSNKDGAFATQSNRKNMLQLFDTQLREKGYKLLNARSLKPKHITYLVERWQNEGLGIGTIKNRLCGLRWWAGKVNKASIIPRTNEELGVDNRTQCKESKAQKLDMAKLEAVQCKRMQLATRMMAAFGLRMEEALKFRPGIADQGDNITLKAAWCKGGRARQIPITFERQRELLDEVRAEVGNASLIPDNKSYIQHRKSFEHATLKAGFSNLHGLRHNYAQTRYKMLTGQACPKAGGGKPMTAEQLRIDKAARQQISKELGHNRLEITKVYLGG